MPINQGIDNVVSSILTPILNVIGMGINFILSSKVLSIIVYLLIVNIVAIVLMAKDKKYAIDGKWRVKESTLLITAMAGGSLGLLYAMYKFKHKTLHKKFTVGVPIIIAIQIVLILFMIFK